MPTLRFPGFTDEWVNTNIGQLSSKVGSGSTPKGGSAVYTDHGHPFVRSQNVGNGILLLEEIAYISEEIHNQQRGTEIKLDDVLLNITGASIGRCAVADERIVGGNVNQHVCIIRSNNIHPSFLSNFILSRRGQKQIDSFQAGGNREGLNFEQIRSIKINVPSKDEQGKISNLLNLVDERIATQNKIIERLESLIGGIVEKLYGGIDYMPLGDLLIPISVRNRMGKDLPVLSVSNKSGFIAQTAQFEDRVIASDDTSNYKVVIKDDFAFNPARINIGSIARLKSYESGIISPMYVSFRVIETVLPEYVEYFLKTKRFADEVEKRLEGSVRRCLTFDALCEIEIPLVDIDSQKAITEHITQLYSKLEIERNINAGLKKQKNYMLNAMFI